MYSWENPDDRVSIAQMNSELQHAQLELLSASCATHQLRLRFSADDLARFGRRDILRKSVQAATAMSEYYASIEKKIPSVEVAADPARVSEDRIREAVDRLGSYLREQREHYLAVAVPLSNHQKALMWPYYSSALLDRVRVLDLERAPLPNPPFLEESRDLGFLNLPHVPHIHPLTLSHLLLLTQQPPP